MKQKRLIIGVTGGIASGKSTVLELLRKRGYPVISSDVLAHQALEPGTPSFSRIRNHFKDQIISKGRIDRKKLGKIVFASSKERKWLESVVHPYVIRELKKFSKTHSGLIFLDIPLLFEAKLERLVDKILLVAVNPSTQIQRLIKHRKMSKPDARLRISAQWATQKKVNKADWVIWNNHTLARFHERISQLVKKIERC